ncbi:MAG TPA: prolipoprotein diacylglyceryl transferase family protein [Anaerolineales bacterium]|nr:prolipoprotein diacylglyceryl transferase family protein [Anaerolineales bacterium]
MFPILQIGPLALRLPGLFLLLGIWVGTSLIDREAPRHRASSAALNNLVLLALIAGVVGARLGYALRYLPVYAQSPLSLFSLNPATLAPLDGVLVALIVVFVAGQRQRLSLWPTLDALTLSLAGFSVFVGLAHLSSGDAFGAPTSVPWAIDLWGARRHPSQLYEIVLAVFVFLAVWRLRRTAAFAGFHFLLWLAMAAGSRLFLEAFRGDSVIVFGVVRAAQAASLTVLAAALAGLHLRARKELLAGKTADQAKKTM